MTVTKNRLLKTFNYTENPLSGMLITDVSRTKPYF